MHAISVPAAPAMSMAVTPSVFCPLGSAPAASSATTLLCCPDPAAHNNGGPICVGALMLPPRFSRA